MRVATDLKRAGIVRKDATGRVVHLHALRKTFLTMAANNGISQRAAQEFAHHSDANLTANTYTDVTALNLADEMGKLPWWNPENEKMRGVDTKITQNGTLIKQLKDLASVLEMLDGKGLQLETTDSALAARHGFEKGFWTRFLSFGQFLTSVTALGVQRSGHKLTAANAS